jgi:hypothetical protein
MAGTLLSAPTLGASDWSTWITLVDACRRGYLAASYTNFSGSAESALAAGSLVEVAGAVYSFTATAIDYTGAGSTNSDLYIYVKPDAAVSTASVVAWGSAPVWVDSKQGFYASAASTTRAVGGMYVNTAGSYGHKYIYTPELTLQCVQRGATRPILQDILRIGEWNMDATTGVTIACPPIRSKVISFDAIIYSDSPTIVEPERLMDNAIGSAPSGLIQFISNQNVFTLTRALSGDFDNSFFDGTASTIPNRGFIYVTYEA